MIATVCEVSTACVEMLSSLERDPPPPVGRLQLAVVVLAAVVIVGSAIDWLRQR